MPTTSDPQGGVDLLFAGTVFCDLVFFGVPVPRAGTEVFAESFLITPGGTANRAVAGARLGSSTVLLSRLGDDVLGRHIRSQLADEPNLDVRFVESVPGTQSPVTVSLTGEHDRSFITYEEPIPGLELPQTLGPVGATHVSIARPIPEWIHDLRATGTTVVGGVGWDSTGTWSSKVLARLDNVDIFVPNDLEAMHYTRTEDAVAAARVLGEHVELAVVTRGADGVVAMNSGTGELIEIPAITVQALDPTGAGDVFVASFMSALRQDWPLEQKLRFAGLCASLSVTSLGGAASAPEPAALARFLAENKPSGDWSYITDWARAEFHVDTKEK